MDNHLADLRLALERLCWYGLKMNGIEIDPKNVCSVCQLVSS
jgi:hypothetical protein